MESIKNYEESYKELQTIVKQLSTESLTINFNKLDSTTAGLLRESLVTAITKRKGELTSIITRVE